MSEIFKYTDPDSDTLDAGEIETNADGRRGWVYIGAGAETVHLPPAEITRLRAALAPYDPEYLAQTDYKEGYAAGQRAADAAPATEIEVGREYRLLPDAHNVGVKSAINGHGVTRVRVAKGPDQGDYRVEALDGDIAGQDWYWVAARYLAPLEQAVDFDSPEAVRLLAEGKYVTTDDSFPLDARRKAAVDVAMAHVKGGTIGEVTIPPLFPRGVFGGTTVDPDAVARAVAVLTQLLLGDKAPEAEAE